jgi:uncharacterized membrane protein
MSQYSRGYEQQPPPDETQTGYTPDPIDLQQFEQQQQSYADPQSSLQQQIPLPQNGPQPFPYYAYMQPVFIQPQPVFMYPQKQNEPDSLSKIAGILSYVGLWFSAFLILLFVRNNRFVRFHAFQSLLLFGTMNVVYIVFFLFAWFWANSAGIWHTAPIALLFVILILAFVMLNVIATISWFVGIGGAMVGKYAKLPFVGDLAEKLAMQGKRPDLYSTESSGQPK